MNRRFHGLAAQSCSETISSGWFYRAKFHVYSFVFETSEILISCQNTLQWCNIHTDGNLPLARYCHKWPVTEAAKLTILFVNSRIAVRLSQFPVSWPWSLVICANIFFCSPCTTTTVNILVFSGFVNAGKSRLLCICGFIYCNHCKCIAYDQKHLASWTEFPYLWTCSIPSFSQLCHWWPFVIVRVQ